MAKTGCFPRWERIGIIQSFHIYHPFWNCLSLSWKKRKVQEKVILRSSAKKNLKLVPEATRISKISRYLLSVGSAPWDWYTNTGPHTQESPVLGLILCCCCLEVLHDFWIRSSVFHFALAPSNYVARLAYIYYIYGPRWWELMLP